MSQRAEAAAAGQPVAPGPGPEQLRQIAALMQRLTKKNAGMMAQRDGVEQERDALLRCVGSCVCVGEGGALEGRTGSAWQGCLPPCIV